jgi:hypothetical protein
MSAPGELRVAMDVGSDFLSNNLPFVVRDAGLAVVHRGTCGSSATLPEGLYSVAVLGAEGERTVQLVRVESDETTTVSFTQPTVESHAESLTSPGDDPLPTVGPASLLSVTGCTVSLADADGWEFVPVLPLTAVPWGEFSIDGRVVEMSLPLNPNGDYPLTSCRVNVDGSGGRPVLRMAFAPGRLVTRLVDGLVRHSSQTFGKDVLEQATSLLLTKYADPAGAALGGLTLHRMDMLSGQRDWVENLAHDFPWLTDGRVLLAALLRGGNPAERQRGFDLLATSHRPMYTDGLSLAVDLLRRWPEYSRGKERDRALDRLAGLSAYADLGSVNLCVQSSGRGPS